MQVANAVLIAPITTNMASFAALFGPTPLNTRIEADFAFIRFGRLHLTTDLTRVRRQGQRMFVVTVVANDIDIGAHDLFFDEHRTRHLFRDDSPVVALPGWAALTQLRGADRVDVTELPSDTLPSRIPPHRAIRSAAAIVQRLYADRIDAGTLLPAGTPPDVDAQLRRMADHDIARLAERFAPDPD